MGAAVLECKAKGALLSDGAKLPGAVLALKAICDDRIEPIETLEAGEIELASDPLGSPGGFS